MTPNLPRSEVAADMRSSKTNHSKVVRLFQAAVYAAHESVHEKACRAASREWSLEARV